VLRHRAMTSPHTVFLACGPGQGYALKVGGITVLERRVRELAQRGTKRIVVAAPSIAFERTLPIPVEFIASDGIPGEEWSLQRGDVLHHIKIVDEQTRRAAERKVVRATNKSFQGPIDALFTWRCSNPITRALSYQSLKLTPNHVTLVAIAVGLIACLVASRASDFWGFAIAGVLLEFNSILDTVDGELARLRYQYSKFGQWLDNLSDDLIDNLFILSIGSALEGVWLWVALMATGGRLATAIYTYATVYRTTGTGDVFAFRWWFETNKTSTDDVYNPLSPVTWLRSLGRRDTYVFCWALACIVRYPQWVVIHGFIIGVVQFGLLTLQFLLADKSRPVPQ
jgi:phosphatidylglycerophosphate synthase